MPLDLKTNLYLVRDGIVAPVLKTPILSSMIPPIDHRIKDLKFRFNGTKKVKKHNTFTFTPEWIELRKIVDTEEKKTIFPRTSISVSLTVIIQIALFS